MYTVTIIRRGRARVFAFASWLCACRFLARILRHQSVAAAWLSLP